MPLLHVDLEVHCANGEERRESLLFDSDREILVDNFGRDAAYVCTYKPEIEKVKRAVKKPTDQQKQPSGFYVKSATITEAGMPQQEFDNLVESLAKHVRDNPRVKRLLAEGWIFHSNYDPRENGALESHMQVSHSPFVHPLNAREVLIIDRAYGFDGTPQPRHNAIYIRNLRQPQQQ